MDVENLLPQGTVSPYENLLPAGGAPPLRWRVELTSAVWRRGLAARSTGLAWFTGELKQIWAPGEAANRTQGCAERDRGARTAAEP